eukprot:scaffold329711_cov36-Prasinocladus_malaysianus.AAC.2
MSAIGWASNRPLLITKTQLVVSASACNSGVVGFIFVEPPTSISICVQSPSPEAPNGLGAWASLL